MLYGRTVEECECTHCGPIVSKNMLVVCMQRRIAQYVTKAPCPIAPVADIWAVYVSSLRLPDVSHHSCHNGVFKIGQILKRRSLYIE